MRSIARPVYNLGTIGVIFGAGALHAAYLAPVTYRFVGSSMFWWWLVLAATQLGVSYTIGLPDLAGSRAGAAARGLAATVAAFAVISAFQALLATPLLPRSSSTLVGIVLPIWTVLAWNLADDTSTWATIRDRVVLIVERPEDLESTAADLQAGEQPATIVGSLLLDEVLAAGTAQTIVDTATEAAATVLVLDAASQASPTVVDQAALLHRRGVRIRTLSLFYEEWIGKLPHAELARVSLLFDVGELHRARYVRSKRVVDLVFAGLGLIALVPLLALTAAANPLLNRGPLIYRQMRVGRDGVPFEMYKLRTMTPSTEGSTWTVEDDHRITPLGRFLRRTHLDELPQVLNIMRGDLSLIGPRPEQPHYVRELADKIDFYDVRHIVRPGLTGWAQVKHGYASDHLDAFEKLQFDFYYLRRQGLALDARIIRRTVLGILRGDGR